MPSVDRVEVLAGIQRRRRYSLDEKLTVLAEAAQPGMSISYVARRHGISPSLGTWPYVVDVFNSIKNG
jgi:transposase